MGTLILNLKNHREFFGEKAVRLANMAESISYNANAEIIVAPATPFLSSVASRSPVKVFCQGIDSDMGGTGKITVGAVLEAGAKGVILNHSDSLLTSSTLENQVVICRDNRLETCICVSSSSRAVHAAKLKPNYIAIEEPTLIGSRRSITNEKPLLIKEALKSARGVGYKGKMISGSGIKNGEEVKEALALGMNGVMVSSVLAREADLHARLLELARPLGS